MREMYAIQVCYVGRFVWGSTHAVRWIQHSVFMLEDGWNTVSRSSSRSLWPLGRANQMNLKLSEDFIEGDLDTTLYRFNTDALRWLEHCNDVSRNVTLGKGFHSACTLGLDNL